MPSLLFLEVPLPLVGVGFLREDLISEGVVEEELGGELVTLFGLGAVADLEVDVYGPAPSTSRGRSSRATWVEESVPKGIYVVFNHLQNPL
jgi:hypothetical protein